LVGAPPPARLLPRGLSAEETVVQVDGPPEEVAEVPLSRAVAGAAEISTECRESGQNELAEFYLDIQWQFD